MNLSELRTGVRIRLSEGSVNDSTEGDAFNNTTIDSYLNSADRKYWAKEAEAGENFNTAIVQINLVLGQRVYPMSDWGATGGYKLVKVSKVYSSGAKIPLAYREGMTDIEYDETYINSTADDYQPTYRLQGNNLYLSLPPNFNEENGLEIEYIPYPTKMTNEENTPNTSLAWHDLIVLRATLSCLHQQEYISPGSVDMAGLAVELKELEMDFEGALEPRVGSPQYVEPFNMGDLEYN